MQRDDVTGMRKTDVSPASLGLAVVGGWITALGAFSVVITSLFYVVSPPAAVAPVVMAPPGAAAAAAVGAATMRVAGTSGVFGNLVMAVGCLLLSIDAARRNRALAAAGWAAIVMSLVVFETVDALVGFVLAPAAADPNGGATFLAFRSLFGVFFLVGTALFGAGAILVSVPGEARSIGARWLAWTAVADGALAVTAALLTFAGLPLELAVGASIGIGSIVFVFVGIATARLAGSPATRLRSV